MVWQFAPGEILTAANLNAVTVPWNAMAIVQRTTVQAITDNTTTDMSFTDADLLDPLAWHSTGVTPERVIPTIAGWYMMIGHSELSSAVATISRRVTRITKNGTAIHQGQDSVLPASAVTGLHSQDTVAVTSLNGTTDYVTMQVFQDDTGGSARNMVGVFVVKLLYPT